MKVIKEVKYYTISEISFMLGISQASTRNKISILGLKKFKTIGEKGSALYTNEQLEQLRGDKTLHELTYEHLMHTRHNSPIVITYHIYESKMNRV
jgi:hypothetical protein